MVTRQEMIDEAVRRVLRPGRVIWTSLSEFDAVHSWCSLYGIPITTLAIFSEVRAEYRRIEAEAARSAVAQAGNG